jgi:hypothetical protein
MFNILKKIQWQRKSCCMAYFFNNYYTIHLTLWFYSNMICQEWNKYLVVNTSKCKTLPLTSKIVWHIRQSEVIMWKVDYKLVIQARLSKMHAKSPICFNFFNFHSVSTKFPTNIEHIILTNHVFLFLELLLFGR